PALLFPKPPSLVAASTFHDGDVAQVVTSGAAVGSFPPALRCDAGLAQAAFLFRLAPGATFRGAVPLDPPRRPRRRGLPRRRAAPFMLAALDRYGLHEEVADVLASYPDRQHADGFFFSQRQEWDSNGAALWALAEHWRLTRDEDLARLTARSVGRGVRWIDRKRHSKRRRKDAVLVGLMPASMSAEHLGPFDYFYWDSFWSARGLLDGADLLDVAGDGALAAKART